MTARIVCTFVCALCLPLKEPGCDSAVPDMLSERHNQVRNAISVNPSVLPHRSYMSRRSDYFSAMLGSSFQEGSSAPGDMLEIQVTDVEPGVLYAALQWVYTDRVDADMPAPQLLQVRPFAVVTG